MRRVELLPNAKQDLVDAAQWYEAERKGLGQDFLRGMALISDGLRRLPERHPVVSGSTRRAKMRRFPYMVLYVVRQDVILIVAVLHEHRHPGRWVERVQEGRVSDRFAGAAIRWSSPDVMSRQSQALARIDRCTPMGVQCVTCPRVGTDSERRERV